MKHDENSESSSEDSGSCSGVRLGKLVGTFICCKKNQGKKRGSGKYY